MRYLVTSITLAVVSFTNLILALTSHYWLINVFKVVRHGSNITNVYSQVNPILNTINTVFWLMFIFSAVGSVIFYILKSHEEEYEQYTKY